MTQIALFHSVLGIREGITDAAARLRSAGHDVEIVDYYGAGQRFDTYDDASTFVESIGFPELMRRAVAACTHLDDGFIAMGFSNGGGMAEHVALSREVAGVIVASGALPISAIGATDWPKDVPAQIHYTAGDPFRQQSSIDELASTIRESAPLELYDDYPGSGHLFTDPSLPAEYDEDVTTLFWTRVQAFCRR